MVKELKQQIEQRNLQTTLNFPITTQEEIPSAIDFLKQSLELEVIPDFAFQLTSLPSPSWELFEETEIDFDTPMQGNEPTQPTINTQGSDPKEELINEYIEPRVVEYENHPTGPVGQVLACLVISGQT
ncbi:2769_t:CDS:2, partial [Gigaspora rosea]